MMFVTIELLQALTSSDTNQRVNAEKEYFTIPLHTRIEGLIQNLNNHPLSAILLRRDIVKLSNINELQALIDPLLQYCNDKSCAECLAQICSSLQWLEPSVAQSTVQRILKSTSSLYVWIAIAERANEAYKLSQCWMTSLPISTNNDKVQNVHLLVATAIAINDDEENNNNGSILKQLSEQYLLSNLIDNNDAIIEYLQDAAENAPTLLAATTQILQSVLQFLIQCNTLQAIQVIITLLTDRKEYQDPALLNTIIPPMLSIVWKHLQEPGDDDDDDWNNVPLHYEDDADSYEFAEALMYELVRLPGTLTHLLPNLEQALTAQDCHRAAMIAIQCCLEGVPVAFRTHFDTAAKAAMELQSNDPRVHYQQIKLLGLLCEHKYRNLSMLETITKATHSPHPKVAAIACQALVSYARSVDTDDAETLLVPYMNDVVQALSQGPIRNAPIPVQIRAVGAIACIASAVGELFAALYSTVMPILIGKATSPVAGVETQTLAGACLESATIVGQAVGELFHNDAHRIMEWALTTQATVMSESLLLACARIASVLGDAYQPYVERILPHLLQKATDQNDIEFTEGNDFTSNEESESMTVAVPGRGLTKVTINSTKIQEKTQAARAIYEHAAVLGPYSQPCLNAFVPLVAFKYSSDLRGVAAQTLAVCMEAACNYGENHGNMNVPKKYLPLVINTISKQIADEDPTDMETMYALADSLSEVCRLMFVYAPDHGAALLGDLSQENIQPMVQSCVKSIVACLERRSKVTSVLSSGLVYGEDERCELETKLQGEEDLLTPLVDSIGYTLKSYRELFIPIFQVDVVPVFGPLLNGGNDIRATLSAVCLFDDCVEYCGTAAAATFAPILLQGVLIGLNDQTNGNDADLKRAAIYGIAQMARYAPANVLASHAMKLAQHLATIITSPRENCQNDAIYENAVSAFGSLVLFDNAPFRNSGFVKRDVVVGSFLDSLPLREDEDEAKICHESFCTMIENGSVDMNMHVNTIARVCRETMSYVEDGEEIASDQTCIRMKTILTRTGHGGEVLQQLHGFPNIVSP